MARTAANAKNDSGPKARAKARARAKAKARKKAKARARAKARRKAKARTRKKKTRTKAKARPWATVNVCDPGDRPGAMGVRVGVPAGPGSQWMRVRAEWYDARTRSWEPATGGDSGWVQLGSGKLGVRSGTTFTFPVPRPGKVLLLRGVARLEWRRRGKVRRKSTVRTSFGHAVSAGGRSWAQCVVPG